MSLSEMVAKLSVRLSDRNGSLSVGDRAALRRLDPRAPEQAAMVLYRLLADCGVDIDRGAELERWAVLANSLALARGTYDGEISVGKALVDIQFGEARLAQLLSADFDVLTDLVPRIARRLAASQQAMNWAPIARLLLAVDRRPEEADRIRLDIARSYVTAQHQDKESRKSR